MELEQLYTELGKAVYQYNKLLEETAALEQLIGDLRNQIKDEDHKQ